MKIIRDTREKENFGWAFSEHEVTEKKLESGDYTIEGMEDKVCIERKHSPSEIAINIGSDFTRFKKELERMAKIPYSYIICEFTLSSLLEFPKNSDIPKSKLSKVRINGKYVVKMLSSFQAKYGVQVIYAGDRDNAIDRTIQIFNTVLELENA
jgi:DNA excision repair protein ERCC-4